MSKGKIIRFPKKPCSHSWQVISMPEANIEVSCKFCTEKLEGVNKTMKLLSILSGHMKIAERENALDNSWTRDRTLNSRLYLALSYVADQIERKRKEGL